MQVGTLSHTYCNKQLNDNMCNCVGHYLKLTGLKVALYVREVLLSVVQTDIYKIW